MYRLKSTWRDFSGWMRMQMFPEPCCSCCWELGERPERHICASMPVAGRVDMVVLPRKNGGGRTPEDALAENLRGWPRDGKRRGEVFVPGPDSGDWRDWAASAGARLIPSESLGGGALPPEGRLHTVEELSECHVVMPEAFATPQAPEALDYFTPNGLPLLFLAGADPVPPSALSFPPSELSDHYAKSGMEVPPGYAPYLGPYGQCKSDMAEMEKFYSGFVAGRKIDSKDYGYLSMLWRYAAARGVA